MAKAEREPRARCRVGQRFERPRKWIEPKLGTLPMTRATALRAAAMAARWDVIVLLARELEAQRLARATGVARGERRKCGQLHQLRVADTLVPASRRPCFAVAEHGRRPAKTDGSPFAAPLRDETLRGLEGRALAGYADGWRRRLRLPPSAREGPTERLEGFDDPSLPPR